MEQEKTRCIVLTDPKWYQQLSYQTEDASYTVAWTRCLCTSIGRDDISGLFPQMLLCRALTFQLETRLAFRGVDLHRGELCTSPNSVESESGGERGKNKERGTSHRKAARSGCPAGRGGELGSWCRRSHLPSSEPLRPERSSHLSPPGTRQQDSSATGPQCLSFEEEWCSGSLLGQTAELRRRLNYKNIFYLCLFVRGGTFVELSMKYTKILPHKTNNLPILFTNMPYANKIPVINKCECPDLLWLLDTLQRNPRRPHHGVPNQAFVPNLHNKAEVQPVDLTTGEEVTRPI